MVTPSQVMCPGSGQLLFTAEQMTPLQLTVLPFQQVTVAMQRAFAPKAGFLAADSGAGVPAREARKA